MTHLRKRFRKPNYSITLATHLPAQSLVGLYRGRDRASLSKDFPSADRFAALLHRRIPPSSSLRLGAISQSWSRHVHLWGITTSANSTVTCLYSAEVAAVVIGAPHLLQNRESGGSSVPHDPQTTAAAVMSRGRRTVVHVTIVSPLASQHVPYRPCDPACGGSALRRVSRRGSGPDSADVRGRSASVVRFCRGVRSCGGCPFGGGDVFVHRC
jgi:hypothetical protein